MPECPYCGETEAFFTMDDLVYCASCAECIEDDTAMKRNRERSLSIASASASASASLSSASTPVAQKKKSRRGSVTGQWVDGTGITCATCGETDDFFAIDGKRYCGCCAEECRTIRFNTNPVVEPTAPPPTAAAAHADVAPVATTVAAAAAADDDVDEEDEEEEVNTAATRAPLLSTRPVTRHRRGMSVSKQNIVSRHRLKRRPSAGWLQPGSHVRVTHGRLKGEEAIIRYIGDVSFAHGLWIGVEAVNAVGQNDGHTHGHRYFTCAADRGLFFKPYTLAPLVLEENDE